jgi:hypothetical protein
MAAVGSCWIRPDVILPDIGGTGFGPATSSRSALSADTKLSAAFLSSFVALGVSSTKIPETVRKEGCSWLANRTQPAPANGSKDVIC